MNKSLGLLAFLFLFFSCTKEQIEPKNDHDSIQFRSSQKVKLCHLKDDGDWKILEVSSNALSEHLNHGDVLLVDNDGDGWVVEENECVPGGDCNDDNDKIFPGAEEICDDGIDNDCDGEIDEDCVVPCWADVIDQFDFSNWGLTIGLEEDPSSGDNFLYQNIASNRLCVDESEIDFISVFALIGAPFASCSYGIDGEFEFFIIPLEEGNLVNAALLQLAADNNLPNSIDVECNQPIQKESDISFLLNQLPEDIIAKLNLPK